MKTQLKTLLCLVASAWTMTLAGIAHSHSYPLQLIQLIIPFAPDGTVDQVVRIIGPGLSKRPGQAIVVENRPSAAGCVGVGELARTKPNGYNLMLALDSQAINHHMVKNLPFDTFKSFDYLNLLVTLP